MLLTLYQIAPEKAKKTQNRKKKPWFDNEPYDQKRIMKNRGSLAEVPKSCTMESLHQRKEQIQHHAQIQKKHHSCHVLILQSKHNTKKLYKNINDMTSGKTLNPMPPNKTDEELGNKFANYLQDKIEKIRSKLYCHYAIYS